MEKRPMQNSNHTFLKSLDVGLDYVLNSLTIYIAYQITRFFFAVESPVGTAQLFLLITLFAFALSVLYNYQNVYLPMRTQSPLFFVGRIFLVTVEVFAVAAVLIILFATDEYDFFYLSWLVWSALASFIIIVSKKITMLTVLHSMRANRQNLKRILLVTDSQEMADEYLEEIFNNPQFGYSVIGYVGNLNVIGLPHLGTTGDLDRILTEEEPDEVVMALDTVRKKLITRYISICNNHCVKVMVVPAICGYFKSPRQISMLGNLPLLDIRSTPLDNMANQILKRAVDIIGSIVMIVVTSPLMLFTAIGVKISSPGPILFKQTRVGRHNKEFVMYKFRSMRVNASEQTGWSTEEDPRKTRFGAFIRKFALDELPQFFNVLKGDMSLVGPRPEVPFYVDKFKKEIPLYMLKHTLRPGITGQAQIKGLRGDTSIEARIEEDINYIENWTIWRDLHILLLTPFRAVNRHEKYAKREKLEEEKQARRNVGNAVKKEDLHDDETD
ncbi:MAG: exopolysaccharide biosynthesis polyprenyl glycosylphosphotransferase [Clostridia bacterium]|nr:exopolysaccharide biosynthesis polyprenyl glycosylphosphotransferase [Clostridia bacterium]